LSSSRTISLFTEQADPGQRPTSFAASILVHGLALTVAWFGFAYKPPTARVTTEYYSTRRLDLRMPAQQRLPGGEHIAYPGPQPAARTRASGGKPSPRLPALRQMAQVKRGPQTLIQPDLTTLATLPEEIPLPQVVIWSPSKTPVKNIVPPLPEKPTTADVRPALDLPTQELNLADINLASSSQPSPNSPVAASTASPLAVHLPQQVQLPPITASQASAQPTPAAILSLSDLRMNGTAILPPVNEAVASSAQGALAQGRTGNPSPPGNDHPAAHAGEAATSPGSATKLNAPDAAAAGAGHSNAANPASGADSAANPYGEPAATQITLPKDGHFGAVIVGDALEDQFPEVAGAWSGRIAYTVFLHVGLAQSWILQYSLPRPAEAAAGGTVAQLDAPWPYNIVRPNLAPGSVAADVLMIHGFLNPSGRFETLSFVLPEDFPRAQFVLGALRLWQFRPAMQDGQPAKVEVLLIIPEASD
jgi:hypothetical protein